MRHMKSCGISKDEAVKIAEQARKSVTIVKAKSALTITSGGTFPHDML